jgi:hypothetical protein
MMAAVPVAALDDEDWEFPESRKYQPYLIHCMSYLHDRLHNPYPKDTIFTKEELLAIQPHHIRKWMNLRAYGEATPNANAHITGCHSNSLLKAKQAISFYMPNKHVPWMEGTGGNPGGGNPTCHISINVLIKKIKKKECRGQGKKANDKGAYTERCRVQQSP